MLDADVMTVVEVARFEGLANTLVPGLAVPVGLDLALGAVAVYLVSRATGSDVK